MKKETSQPGPVNLSDESLIVNSEIETKQIPETELGVYEDIGRYTGYEVFKLAGLGQTFLTKTFRRVADLSASTREGRFPRLRPVAVEEEVRDGMIAIGVWRHIGMRGHDDFWKEVRKLKQKREPLNSADLR